MNIENLNKVIATIEGLKPHKLEMNLWLNNSPSVAFKECGTVGCIGGWAEATARANGSINSAWAYLGLTAEQASDLFYQELSDEVPDERAEAYEEALDKAFEAHGIPDGYNISLSAFDTFEPELRKRIILRVLRTLRDTGEVRWAASLLAEAPQPITKPNPPPA